MSVGSGFQGRLEVHDAAAERRRLSLRQIEVFRAVMLSGSINGASRMLNVSQPSLSRVVRRMEDVLGFRLFERAQGRLIPTEEAGALINLVSRVYRQLDEIDDAIERLTTGDGGQFRLGSTGSPGRCLVPRAIASISKKLPGLRFQVDVLLFDQIIDYLLFKRGECVVSIFPIRHPLIATKPIATGELVALVPQHHALAGREQAALSELSNDALVSFGPDTPHGAIVMQMFRTQKITPRLTTVIRHVETAIGLVASGAGVAILDEFSVADRSTLPVSILRIRRALPVHIHLSVNKDVVHSHFYKKFEKSLTSVLLSYNK